MKLKASIDIGSNSILLLIGEVEDTKINVLREESRITQLGKNIDRNGHFDIDSKRKSYDAFKDYYSIIKNLNIKPKDVIITATEASRVASDADEFFDKVKRDFSFDVTKISGEGEAFYTAKGVCSSFSNVSEVSLLDVGGASSELIKVVLNPFKIQDSVSLPIGAVRFNPYVLSGKFNTKAEEVLSSYDLELWRGCSEIIGVGGSIVSLIRMIHNLKTYSPEILQTRNVSIEDLQKFSKKMMNMSNDELVGKYEFISNRIESIRGGVETIKKIMIFLSIQQIKCSTRGLRFGTILSKEGIDERFKI